MTFYELVGDVRERQEVWTADAGSMAIERGDIEPGTSQVDEFTIDGNTATATATFYEQFSDLVAEGTFEVTCAS